MEIFRCILDRRQRRCIVVNSGVDQDGPVPGIRLRGRREVIYPAGLDIDGGNFGVIVFRKDGEFDGSAPSRWFQYRRDVIVSWSAVTIVSPRAAAGIEKRLPQDRLGPRYHVLPDLIRHNCRSLEVVLFDSNLTHFSESLGPSRCFARTRWQRKKTNRSYHQVRSIRRTQQLGLWRSHETRTLCTK